MIILLEILLILKAIQLIKLMIKLKLIKAEKIKQLIINLNTQYTTLFTDKSRKGNNLEEKRIQKRNNSYIFESRDKSKNKNNEKFNIIYQKFLEDEKKKNENIERMKRIKEEKEKKIYLYKPRINIKSKELVNKKRGNKEDFYTRQKKLMEQYKKKDEILKEKLRIEKIK